MNKQIQPVVLLVIDGWGVSIDSAGNAISHANTPCYDYLISNFPNREIQASGESVGLPKGVMGNSEVGHLTIGIGRILFQSYERINQAIRSNSIRNNANLRAAINHSKENHSKFHLFGLLSDGGVHSHIDHLKHLIEILSSEGVSEVYIHAFTDGRDVPPDSSDKYVRNILEFINSYPNTKLADIIGRYYAMDRDKRWDRTKIAYDMLTQSRLDEVADPLIAIQERFDRNEFDEFLTPIIVNNAGTVDDNDVVLFYNFRPDRARQITEAFTTKQDLFKRKLLQKLHYVTMTQYDAKYQLPVLFDPEIPDYSLAEVYSKYGLTQIHIAETEKYAHVTYFINGGQEVQFNNEERLLIPSNKQVATYDLAPEMSTDLIADAVCKAIKEKVDDKPKYDLIIFNIAAPDMVGHTGVFQSTVKAVEITDKAMKKVYDTCMTNGYTFIITADHGNAEKMLNDGKPHTAHTSNPVPFIVTDKNVRLFDFGGLADVAPTILDLIGIDKPKNMSGKSMLKH